MGETTDELRRRIALYRSYISQGVSQPLATNFEKLIAIAEAKLAKLGGRGKTSEAAPLDC